MDNAQKLNNKIQKAAEDLEDIPSLINLFQLIEFKIRFVSKRDDLTSFSSLIRKLNLGKDIENQLIKVRNRVVHSREINFEDEIASFLPYLTTQVIPAVIAYESGRGELNTESRLNEMVIEKLRKHGFEILINQLEIEPFLRNQTYPGWIQPIRPDFFVKINDKIIVFEVKGGPINNRELKSIGLRQLEKFLLVTKLKYGVLVILGSEVESHKIDGSKILVLGYEADFSNLKKWAQKK